VVAIWQSLPAFEKTQRRFYYPGLFPVAYIILGRGLNIFLAGLYLYKMYSILIKRDDVYLKMSASPVSLEYRVPEPFKVSDCDILSKLS
jgi:hypothetical protein